MNDVLILRLMFCIFFLLELGHAFKAFKAYKLKFQFKMTIHCFYRCDCPDGYKGRDCTEKEYCYWFVCPNGSECVSLIDGHECVSNATFNGLNSTVVVRPNDGGNLSDATITATFRTQRNGTLLHILGSDNTFIRLSVQGKKVVIEVPEKDSTSVTSVFGRRANDGKWHTVSFWITISFYLC